MRAVLLVVVLWAGASHAQDCSDDIEVQNAIDDQIRGLNIWSWSWGSIYAAGTVAQIAAAAAVRDPNARIDIEVGAIGSAVGSLSFFLLPLRITQPLLRVRNNWKNEPNRCAILQKAADESTIGKSWLGHVGNVVINTVILLVLGVGFHHWQSGLVSAGVGIAVGELNLWTQPTHLHDVLERETKPQIRLVPLVGDINGAGFAFSF